MELTIIVISASKHLTSTVGITYECLISHLNDIIRLHGSFTLLAQSSTLLQTSDSISIVYSMVEGCGCQMNTTYRTGKGREANKSHWLIIDIAKLYRQTVNDTGGR